MESQSCQQITIKQQPAKQQPSTQPDHPRIIYELSDALAEINDLSLLRTIKKRCSQRYKEVEDNLIDRLESKKGKLAKLNDQISKIIEAQDPENIKCKYCHRVGKLSELIYSCDGDNCGTHTCTKHFTIVEQPEEEDEQAKHLCKKCFNKYQINKKSSKNKRKREGDNDK